MGEYAGSDWIKTSLKKQMSPLGEKVADLLGDVFYGIYHLDHRALDRVNWDDDVYVEYIMSYKSLSTVDFDELTRLVVLAHDAALRLDIRSVAPKRMALLFHQRTREGDVCHRCPTMEDHIALIRNGYKEVEAEKCLVNLKS